MYKKCRILRESCKKSLNFVVKFGNLSSVQRQKLFDNFLCGYPSCDIAIIPREAIGFKHALRATIRASMASHITFTESGEAEDETDSAEGFKRERDVVSVQQVNERGAGVIDDGAGLIHNG